jgi:hypothetical protein
MGSDVVVMKTQFFLRITLAGVLMALVSACATSSTSPKSVSLVGRWSNSLGTVWILSADGTFQVDLNKDGKTDISGNYIVSGNMITINEVHGNTAKVCKQPATYSFERVGNELHFTLVNDKCKLRVKNVLRPWFPT